MTGPLYRFEMHRTSDGTFTGTITDHYGWVIALRAAPEQTSDGKKHLVGHGWIEERAEEPING